MIYCQTITVDHIIHAEQAPAIFLWQKIHPARNAFPSAKFAIRFSILTEPSFGSIDLAWSLLHFVDIYSTCCSAPLTLINFAYHITPTRVFGLLLYDEGLQGAYDMICKRACDDPVHYMAPHVHIPISAFPDTNSGRQIADQDTVRQLMIKTAYAS